MTYGALAADPGFWLQVGGVAAGCGVGRLLGRAIGRGRGLAPAWLAFSAAALAWGAAAMLAPIAAGWDGAGAAWQPGDGLAETGAMVGLWVAAAAALTLVRPWAAALIPLAALVLSLLGQADLARWRAADPRADPAASEIVTLSGAAAAAAAGKAIVLRVDRFGALWRLAFPALIYRWDGAPAGEPDSAAGGRSLAAANRGRGPPFGGFGVESFRRETVAPPILSGQRFVLYLSGRSVLLD